MKVLLAAVLAALVLPAVAAAHASLVRTGPADGAVLARAPAAVRIVFDDVVEPGPGIEAVRNGGGSVLAGKSRIAGGKTLVVPLRRGLTDGDYTVRWAIVSDDGHLESGVLAFAVGLGRARPVATLGAEATGARPADVIARWLFLAGILGSVGIALFALVTRTRDDERIALVLATTAVVAALGAADESHRAGLSTRAGTALVVGSAAAIVVALVAAAATLDRRALRPAALLALLLVPVPTTAGHALDQGLSRINVAADILHVAGASAWVGALLGFAVTRRRELRLVAVGVALLAVTGVVRAVYELPHVSQLWGTGYGRALLVKTGILLVALAFGARRRQRIELVLVAGLVVAVAVLVLQRPGRNVAPAARAAVPVEAQRAPPRPPADAVIAARASGPYGVALESEPRRLTVVVLSPSGGGASGLGVTIDGRRAEPCGPGCYRVDGVHGDDVDAVVAGRLVRLRAPAAAPVAAADVRELGVRFRAQRGVSFVERLASGPGHAITARWRLESPDRVGYAIAGGSQAIVIGARRWDRDTPGGRWVESPQSPLRQPATQWRAVSNAHRVGPRTITFADPTVPAFFSVELARDGRLRLLRMTAAAHFMTDRYVNYDSARALRPPR